MSEPDPTPGDIVFATVAFILLVLALIGIDGLIG